MHIAQIHWAFPPVIGGVESHLAMLGPELIKNKCKVSLLTGAFPGAPQEEFYKGMYIRRTPLMDLNSLSPEKLNNKKDEIRDTIKAFIEQVKPDIIHAHNMHYFSPVHADILYEIKKSMGIPLILTAHNVWADDDKTWQELNKRSHIWDMVIAVSHYIRKELIRVGFDKDRVVVVHHGIDINRFSPSNTLDIREIDTLYPEFKGRRVIFHPARMSLDKGCHVSVKALDFIRREYPDVLLVLAGTGKTVDWGSQQQKHVKMILELVNDYKLKDNVFIKFFAWDDMPLIYKAAEFCVYPSCFEEPFGLVMLESMATEKPIVVSKAGGMPEIVRSGVNGYVVEMNNPYELAEKCCLLLSKPKLCRELGQKGRLMVEKIWNKDVMTQKTLEVYKSANLETNNISKRIKNV